MAGFQEPDELKFNCQSVAIINQELIESSTHKSDQIIHFFARFTLSSSPAEIKYITPEIITAIIAKIATYGIIKDIASAIACVKEFSLTLGEEGIALLSSGHPGSP